MTIYIKDDCANPLDVKKAIRALNYEDFDRLATIIEFHRSKGKNSSKAKVTSKVLLDAIELDVQLRNAP